MRKSVLALLLLLAAPAAWSGDYFTLGGVYAYGSNVSSGVDVQTQDLEGYEFFGSITLEEETYLSLRAGRIEPRKGLGTSLELDFVAMTVSYLFPNPLGETGFYAGPSYYSGEVLHAAQSPSGGTVHTLEEVDKFGATGGVESFFPLTPTFQIYAQFSGHYIPADEQQFTMQLGLGLAIRF